MTIKKQCINSRKAQGNLISENLWKGTPVVANPLFVHLTAAC